MSRSDARRRSKRRVARAAIASALVVFGCASAGIVEAGVVEAGGCPSAGGEAVVLASIEPRLELRLADGRLIRLAGTEAEAATPDDPEGAETARVALLAALKGPTLSIVPLAARADRWGRIPAWVFAEGAAPPGGVATMAVAAGLARYRPDAEAAACRAELRAAEAAARRARLGLWRDPYYSVLAADDRAAFAARAGSDVVVEARLVAVEPGPYRTRLRFAGSGRRLAATVRPRAMKTFEAQGVDFSSLIGRTLRLRGLLDERFGPHLELEHPDEVEILPAESTPSPGAPPPPRN